MRELETQRGRFDEIRFEVSEGKPCRRDLFAGIRFACDAEGRWTLGDRSGRFFAGESRVVRVIWDEPVLDYFVGSGVRRTN